MVRRPNLLAAISVVVVVDAGFFVVIESLPVSWFRIMDLMPAPSTQATPVIPTG
jgi:hypothetical protein